MPRKRSAPSYDNLVSDLKTLRRSGITKLRGLDLPALAAAAVACGEADPGQPVKAPAIESMLRSAVDYLDGEPFDILAGLMFQLAPGTRGYDPTESREAGAEVVGRSVETYRHNHEPRTIAQVAEVILNRIHANEMRLARLEQSRRPPDATRLAIKWLERFESYYRVWTPVYALAADLTAYRSTLLEPDRPWDHVDGDGDEYTQEIQAAGYVSTALYWFTAYLEHLRRFMVRHGGLWLLSDEPAGQEVADAIYRIGWHSPNNERDDSYLRTTYREAHGELHPFLNRLKAEKIGSLIHEEWHGWSADCECAWEASDDDGSYFPTRMEHPAIASDCSLHLMVEACGDFCRLVDEDWFRIQDWYSIDQQPGKGVSGEELYRRYPRYRTAR